MHSVRVPQIVFATLVLPVFVLWALCQLFGALPDKTAGFPAATYLVFITPALAVAATLPGALLGGAALHADRESGVLEHLLASPVSPAAILAGSALAAVVGSLITSLTIFLVAIIGGLAIHGPRDILTILPICVALSLLYGGIGTTLAVFVRRQSILIWSCSGLLIGSFLLSDIVLPSSMLPGWLMDIGSLNPVTYASHAARQAIAAHPAWESYQHDLLVIAGLAVLSIVVALATFRRGGDGQW
jgi:ABC-2 type transport system permease protein